MYGTLRWLGKRVGELIILGICNYLSAMFNKIDTESCIFDRVYTLFLRCVCLKRLPLKPPLY